MRRLKQDKIDAVCRFCLEASSPEKGDLVAPCQCKGSMEFVHLQCLHKWQRQARSNAKRNICEVCKTPYTTPSPPEADILVSFVTCFLPAATSAYLVNRVFPQMSRRAYYCLVPGVHVCHWLITGAALFGIYKLKYMSEMEKWTMHFEMLNATNNSTHAAAQNASEFPWQWYLDSAWV